MTFSVEYIKNAANETAIATAKYYDDGENIGTCILFAQDGDIYVSVWYLIEIFRGKHNGAKLLAKAYNGLASRIPKDHQVYYIADNKNNPIVKWLEGKFDARLLNPNIKKETNVCYILNKDKFADYMKSW